ncbi:MAG: hypothetical protein R3345_03155 [Fulvivirga sp.]|nr:hypothetical protein [Fulvivirga sp.]
MEESSSGEFLQVWHQVMTIGAIVAAALALLVYLYHQIKVSSLKAYKDKYDYIRQYEIKTYKICFIFIAIAIAMIINTYGKGELTFDPVWFFVRTFMSVAGGTLVGYISALILQYYYPTRLNKKLKKWRYMPRTNPKTGNRMRLLREDEEDVHLDEGMQAEEDVFSVDYDVWLDEQTGDTVIEKYKGHLEAQKCNNCGFYTMKVIREEIVKPPSDIEEGELIKHYECQYCGSVRATQFNIAKDEVPGRIDPGKATYAKDEFIDVITVVVHTSSGEKKNYEFQNKEEAIKFMKEFDVDKVQ